VANLHDYLFHEEPGITLYCGDALTVLRELPAESVQTCVTSPPYWGLRDYGVDGQLGLEPTPGAYVAALVEVFREVRRVLRDDGTLWLNLGDSYHSGNCGGYRNDSHRWENSHMQATAHGTHMEHVSPNRLPQSGLKDKDLVGVPWRVAFALQADGWYLRSDIIWAKPNPMPESVTDRPTKAHEYMFLMSKSATYYYDAEAIKEPAIYGDPRKPYAPGQVDSRGSGHDRAGGNIRPSVVRGRFKDKTEAMATEGRNAFRAIEDWRNRRSVWTVATTPYPEAHFATFPPDLIKPCILAGAPSGGVVLDPFGGALTTVHVAKELGRRAVAIDLNRDYLTMGMKRLRQEVLPL